MLILKEGNHISLTINSLHADDFIASRTLLTPEGFNEARHYHDNAHFSFVLKGGCAEIKRERYERLPGGITFYKAGEPHQITKFKELSYHVNYELPARFFEMYEIKEELIDQAVRGHPRATLVMLKVYQELQQMDMHSESSLRMLLLNLFWEEAKLERPGVPPWIKMVREILHDRWNERVTLAELAETCCIHPVTISRYFPVYFSHSLGEYHRMLKIKRAISMIKSSQGDLSAVAYACGFSDQSHFIRNFKSLTGFLPTQYQKL